ncbi:ATP-grasp domain-containing protein [Mediterraneibacter sp. ICN-202921]|uniref:ATP-grasp domain-containing protein n=1 Tax=Mediterraneibacter sp. ICN-202921 TaxID=3134657 RepID=UPI0030C624B0
MKKVMILGANNGQIPFMNICKKQGAEVIAVSIAGEYPGFQVADKSYYCDISDKEGVLEIAQKEKIDAVLTDQTDVSVPTAAYVAERLGLKGIGYETAVKFSDKYVMRQEAKKAGVGVPAFEQASDYQEAAAAAVQMQYPLMVKPTNSSGSRGVHKVNRIEELREAVEDSIRYSGNGKAIIEEFIEGKEYIVDGLAIDYNYINTDLGIKEYFNKPNMYISKMCMFSSADRIDDEKEKMVLDANKKLVESMRLKFGITHGEYIYSKRDDKVYLVEIAARGGGVYLSSDLTPLASGIQTNEILIDYVLNNTKYDLGSLKFAGKVSAWRCFELIPGTIRTIAGVEETKRIPGVYKVCLEDLYVGKEVQELINDTRKHGPILVWGDSREECFSCLRKVEKTLQIETSGENGVQGIYW